MKKCVCKICLLFFLLQVVLPVSAKMVYEGQITVTPHDLRIKGDSLYVNLDLDMTALKVDPDRSLELTPILVSGKKELELPSILINGKRRHAVYQRENSLRNQAADKPLYAVVKSDKVANEKIQYKYSIALEKWMYDARLDLKEDLCGCAGHKQQVAIENLVKSIFAEQKISYEMQLQMAYIKPKQEEVKKRFEEHQSYLDFPVGKATIVPEFGNNPQELSTLISMIEKIEQDKNIKVTHVDIVGYASPEGSVKGNATLSRGRAEALKRFLLSKTRFSSDLYNVKEGGEDWEGLSKLIENSTYPDRESILSTITYSSGDSRKSKLKALSGGEPYKKMYAELFPKLRRVVSSVRYTVRGFDIDEAKEYIKTRPQLLSLEEMFMAANTYPEGSESFDEIFEIAVRLFPDNEIANLNAAASALTIKDVTRAEKYLSRADKNTAEYLNNQGVLLLLKEDYDNAQQLFNRSLALGSKVAQHNLDEVKKKLEEERF